MDTNVFCVLCGNSFDLEHHIYNIDPQTEAYQWLYDVRLLGSLSTLCSLRMTSSQDVPCNISKINDIFLSEPTRWVTTDFDIFQLGNSYYQVLTDDEDGNVLFPLHYSCIQIGCNVLEIRLDNSIEMRRLSALARLEWLLRLHFRYRKYFGGLIGNDLLGLDAGSENFGPRSILAMDELGWWGDEHQKFLTDPINIPSLTSSIVGVLQCTPQRCDYLLEVSNTSRPLQPLERLPKETLDRIADFLPPPSIMSLHKTSKTLAFKLPLEDGFWRNRLLDGSLLPHLWDLKCCELKPPQKQRCSVDSCVGQQWNWSSLVSLLAKREFPIYRRDPRLDELPLGFINRCRIWNIVEELCTHHEHPAA